MFKYIALALVLTTCDCQYNWINGYQQPQAQYILVQAPTSHATQLRLAPYLTRQAYTLPQSYLASAAAPRQIIVRQQPIPKPVVLQAPAPAPRAVVRVTEENSGPSEPYNFGFESTDEQGNILTRSESSDGAGNVKGSYSYTDSLGLNRVVDYIADAAGFRANVRTNEPGTANADPADVTMQVSDPPAAVQEIVAQYSLPRAKVRSN